jgi:translation initiation factor 1
MNRQQSDSTLVYSTAGGTCCPSCGKPSDACICRALAAAKIIPGDGTVRVSRETKGRGGKGVTLVTGVPLPAAELDRLARELKQKCGCGGTVKAGVIEIQGDKRELLCGELKLRGFRVKIAGG